MDNALAGRSGAATEAVPQAPGALPFLGHAIPLLRDPLRFLVSLPPYGDLVQIRIGPFRAIVVCGPVLTQKFLVDDRTFIPFGGGARKCIGDRFGVAEAALVVATIATRWRLRPTPGNDDKVQWGLTLRPRKLRLRATAR